MVRIFSREIRSMLVLLLGTGCAVHATPLLPDHPANADAPVGRIAGAPASLRPGVVVYGEAPSAPAEPPTPADPGEPTHHHHH